MRKDFQAKQLGIAMDDEELIEEFIRTERGTDGVEITVCEIEWPTPNWPVSHWTCVTRD